MRAGTGWTRKPDTMVEHEHGQTIAITGGRGYLGSALVPALAEAGHAVISLQRTPERKFDHPAVSVVHGLNAENVQQAAKESSVFIHMAARNHRTGEASENFSEAYRRDILELSEMVGKTVYSSNPDCRLVHLSTANVELAQGQKSTPYSRFKQEAEQNLLAIFGDAPVRLVILRPPLVYDLEASGNFGTLVKLVKSGLPIPVPRRSVGRAYISRQNLVSAILAAVEAKTISGGLYEIGDRRSYALSEVLAGIAARLHIPCRTVKMPAAWMGLAMRTLGQRRVFETLMTPSHVDSSRFQAEFGWTQEHDWLCGDE